MCNIKTKIILTLNNITMKKIKIIREPNLQDFENEINRLILEGWKTNGNIIIDKNSHYQKMKKKT